VVIAPGSTSSVRNLITGIFEWKHPCRHGLARGPPGVVVRRSSSETSPHARRLTGARRAVLLEKVGFCSERPSPFAREIVRNERGRSHVVSATGSVHARRPNTLFVRTRSVQTCTLCRATGANLDPRYRLNSPHVKSQWRTCFVAMTSIVLAARALAIISVVPNRAQISCSSTVFRPSRGRALTFPAC